MLRWDLPDRYHDAVKIHAPAESAEDPFTKTLFGWILPTTVFKGDKDTIAVDKLQSNEDIRKADDCNGHLIQELPGTTKEDEMDEILLKIPREKAQNEDDEQSVETQSTVESDWDDLDDDWNDTLSTSSSDDEESLGGERIYDDWLFRTTLANSEYDDDSEGHSYFSPTPEDFPRVLEPPAAVGAQQRADLPENTEHTPQEFDFWVGLQYGVKQNLDKLRSFTEQTIEQLFQQGDDIRKKVAERESFANTACRSLPAEKNAIKVAPSSRDRQPIISRERVKAMNDTAKAKAKKATAKIMLTKTHTQDNLAQFFTASAVSSSRSMARAQNTLGGSQQQFDKVLVASKDMFNSLTTPGTSKSLKKKPTRPKTASLNPRHSMRVPVKATHRRTRSQRLIPSALGNNDFPWY